MEQNKILLLSDLDAMYLSLYDLFNQNFTFVSKKITQELLWGVLIIYFLQLMMDLNVLFQLMLMKKTQNKKKVSFLNRLEKYIISFENLLNEKFIKEADRIYEMVQNFGKYFKIEKNKFKIYILSLVQIMHCQKMFQVSLILNYQVELIKVI